MQIWAPDVYSGHSSKVFERVREERPTLKLRRPTPKGGGGDA